MAPVVRLAALAAVLALAACKSKADRTTTDSAGAEAAKPGGLDTAASRTDTTMIRLDTLRKDTTGKARRP